MRFSFRENKVIRTKQHKVKILKEFSHEYSLASKEAHKSSKNLNLLSKTSHEQKYDVSMLFWQNEKI